MSAGSGIQAFGNECLGNASRPFSTDLADSGHKGWRTDISAGPLPDKHDSNRLDLAGKRKVAGDAPLIFCLTAAFRLPIPVKV